MSVFFMSPSQIFFFLRVCQDGLWSYLKADHGLWSSNEPSIAKKEEMLPDDFSGLFTPEIFANGTIAFRAGVVQIYHRYGCFWAELRFNQVPVKFYVYIYLAHWAQRFLANEPLAFPKLSNEHLSPALLNVVASRTLIWPVMSPACVEFQNVWRYECVSRYKKVRVSYLKQIELYYPQLLLTCVFMYWEDLLRPHLSCSSFKTMLLHDFYPWS